MKKSKATLIIIGILFTTLAFSQIRIGINAGANLSKFKGNLVVENADSKVGFLIGAYFEYYLKENLSLKSNLNFERRIISLDDFVLDEFGQLTISINQNFKYNYLTLPILLKYEAGNSKKIFFNGGFELDYLLNIKAKTEGVLEDNSTFDLNQIDLNFSIGIGTIFNIDNKNNLNVELRFNPNIANISKESYVENPIKNNTLKLVASWNFEL